MTQPRKRIIIQKPGSYNTFRFDNTPLEDPGPGEIQVEVKACGVNFADVCVRLGIYAAAKGSYPICPGLEFSGLVKMGGKDSGTYRAGDRVFGVTRFGAYTTAINCPSEHLWHLPENWDSNRGAAFPVAYLTAHYGLHTVGHLRKTDQVLIHSAAGGVGTALLHLLKVNGNTATGVVGRPEKLAMAKKAGAAYVIDKSTEDLWKRAEALSPGGYDMILDANGASTLKESFHHLGPAGRLLVYGFASMLSHSGRKNLIKLIWTYLRTPRFDPFEMTGNNKTVSGFNLIYLFDEVTFFRRIMEKLLSLDKEGHLSPMPVTEFAFEDVVRAHQAIESGNTVGKLVLVVSG